MWWQRLDVPEHFIRALLGQVTAKWGEQRGNLRTEAATGRGKDSPEFKLSRVAKAAIDKADKVRLTHPLVRQVRKRAGAYNFPSLLRVLLEVAIGTFAGFDTGGNAQTAAEDRALVEEGLGLERARTDRLPGVGPWLESDTGASLQQVSVTLEQYPVGFDLESTNIDQLAATRDEVGTFLRFIDSYSSFLERSFGRGAFGVTVMGWIVRHLKPADQGFMLLFWRSARASGLGPHLDRSLEIAQQWNLMMVPLMRGLEELREAFPETEEILSAKQMGRALRHKGVMEQTFKALRLLHEQRTAEVDAFFAKRPEIQQAVDAFEAAQHAPDAGEF
jgi:hypothetical protein